MADKELIEYKKQIGDKEYLKQYHALYVFARDCRERNSGLEYKNDTEKINKLRVKYKSGVKLQDIKEMLGIEKE